MRGHSTTEDQTTNPEPSGTKAGGRLAAARRPGAYRVATKGGTRVLTPVPALSGHAPTPSAHDEEASMHGGAPAQGGRARRAMIAASLALACWLAAGISDAQAMRANETKTGKAPPFTLTPQDVEQAVGEALAQAGVAEHVSATLTSTRKPVLYEAHHPLEVELHTLSHTQQSKSWSANMVVVQGNEVLTAQPLSGRYQEQRALPVLTKRVTNGHVITESDVEMRLFPVTKVMRNTITDINQLIGMTPQRTISADRPVRSTELSAPLAMESGHTVQMTYHSGALQLTTLGEALEEGAVGDYIRVRNLDSNKVVRARVVSADVVQAALAEGAR